MTRHSILDTDGKPVCMFWSPEDKPATVGDVRVNVMKVVHSDKEFLLVIDLDGSFFPTSDDLMPVAGIKVCVQWVGTQQGPVSSVVPHHATQHHPPGQVYTTPTINVDLRNLLSNSNIGGVNQSGASFGGRADATGGSGGGQATAPRPLPSTLAMTRRRRESVESSSDTNSKPPPAKQQRSLYSVMGREEPKGFDERVMIVGAAGVKVGKNDPVRATLITTVPRLRRLLEKVGLEAPQQLTVGRVLDVMSCDKHCVVNKHVMVAGRCGRSTCLLCDGTYQDTSDVATLLLGAKDRVPRLRSMLEPVVDTTNHAHYVSSTSRIGTYEAISGSRSGIEPCPSILVDKLALAQIKQGKRANAAVKLKLAKQCCFGPSSSEHRAFLTFIES